MKRIDQFFKENLSTRGLEYNDAHWAGMEELLDQNKKAFWFSNRMLVAGFILLIGLSAASIWWMSQEKTRSSQTQAIVETPPVHINMEAQNEESVAIIDSISVEIPHTFELKLFPNFPNYIDYSPSSVGVIYQHDHPFTSPNTAITNLTVTNIQRIDSNLKAKTIDLKPLIGWPKYAINLNSLPQKNWIFYVGTYWNFINYNKVLSPEVEQVTSSQKAHQATNYGLQFRLQRNNWSVLTGIGRTKLTETTNFETTTTTWSYSIKYRLLVDEYSETPRGKKVSLIKKEIDSVGTNTTAINCPNCETTFSYLDIPLAFQYDVRKNRISAFGQLGVTMGILQNASGLYGVSVIGSGTDNVQLQVEDLTQNQAYLNPILWQKQARLGIKYHLNSRWSALATYGISQSLNSMLIDLDQKTKNQQLGLGIEFRIEKK